jgi:hypothetical protein
MSFVIIFNPQCRFIFLKVAIVSDIHFIWELTGVMEEKTRGKTISSERSSLIASSTTTSKEETTKQLTLDDVNPVGLGRKARQLYDGVWKRLTELGQLTRSYDDELEQVLVGGAMCDFTTPDAELTTILVAGSTGKVGRILIRKLMLRGYKVKVFAYLHLLRLSCFCSLPLSFVG